MTTAIELPTAGAYRVDPELSTVSFRTRHLFGLAPVRGPFRLREGHTGLSARDTTVRSGQYLDALRHPDITFVSTRLDGGG